jgi:peptidoglycan/LPS O-acetylase OafA/YrhL
MSERKVGAGGAALTVVREEASRNAWLDLCRALAIVLVLLSHGRVFLRDAFPWTEVLRFGGFMGVELFFVLSGYLIGGILIRSSEQSGSQWLRTFYARRWMRTLPNYYLFLLLNLLLVYLSVRTGDPADAWRYAFFVQNLFSPPPIFFQEAWSLAVEEVFYLLFPPLFMWVARLKRCSNERAIMYAAVGVIVACLLARMVVATSVISWEEEVRKVVFLRFDTLMYGVLLAWLHASHARMIRPPVIGLAVLLFVMCNVYFAGSTDSELNASIFAKTLFMSLASIGCAGLVIAGLRWSLPGWLAAGGGFVARVSYAAYLTNIPVAMLIVKLTPCCNIGLSGAMALWLMFMTVSLGTAYLLYRSFEQPINQLRNRWFPG